MCNDLDSAVLTPILSKLITCETFVDHTRAFPKDDAHIGLGGYPTAQVLIWKEDDPICSE